ncbi:MAG: response regulator transcription factor [Bacteroidota bacterium]
MKSNTISIILTDDHPFVRDGIKALLAAEKNLEVIDEASDGQEAIEKIKAQQPDIAVIDIRMPGMNGLEAVAQLTEANLPTRSIMLSMHNSEEYILESIKAGAHGYILKDAPTEELLTAIEKVANGEKYYSSDVSNVIIKRFVNTMQGNDNSDQSPADKIKITKRERQILDLVLSGFRNKEIAEQLNKSVRTIETHRLNLMKKLNARNVAELARNAREMGVIE